MRRKHESALTHTILPSHGVVVLTITNASHSHKTCSRFAVYLIKTSIIILMWKDNFKVCNILEIGAREFAAVFYNTRK